MLPMAGRLPLLRRVIDDAVKVMSSAFKMPATATFIGLSEKTLKPSPAPPARLLTKPVCLDSDASVKSMPAASVRFVAAGTAISASPRTDSENASGDAVVSPMTMMWSRRMSCVPPSKRMSSRPPTTPERSSKARLTASMRKVSDAAACSALSAVASMPLRRAILTMPSLPSVPVATKAPPVRRTSSVVAFVADRV